MSVDKLVDSTQLDTDLASVANAIRAKGGTSAQLAFPAGFVSAVNAIPTGGGGDTLKEVLENTITSISDDTITKLNSQAFRNNTNITSAEFPNVTNIVTEAFRGCSKLANINVKSATSVKGNAFMGTKITAIALPKLLSVGTSALANMSYCEAIDVSGYDGFRIACLQNCTRLTTLIIRSTRVPSLAEATFINGTPFKSGGTGGTIYIPKVLYDHLGDGSSYDYKAATNWSTVDGYGTITWAQIEGSQYENYYADGTPIPTT